MRKATQTGGTISVFFLCFAFFKKQFIFNKAVRKERKKASIVTQSIYFCFENYMQLFGSGLAFIAKAWAGLMQAVSTAMFIQGKNFLYFTPSPADERMEKRLSYQAKLSASASGILCRLCKCTSRTRQASTAKPRHNPARMNMWL